MFFTFTRESENSAHSRTAQSPELESVSEQKDTSIDSFPSHQDARCVRLTHKDTHIRGGGPAAAPGRRDGVALTRTGAGAAEGRGAPRARVQELTAEIQRKVNVHVSDIWLTLRTPLLAETLPHAVAACTT